MKRPSTSGTLAWLNLLLGVVGVLYPVMLYASAVLGGFWWNVYSPSQILPFLFPAFVPLAIGLAITDSRRYIIDVLDKHGVILQEEGSRYIRVSVKVMREHDIPDPSLLPPPQQ